MADNLKTTQAINNLLIARQGVIQETNKELTKQVALQRDLCNAIECADTDTFENLRNSMKDAAQAAADGEKDFNKLNKRLNRSEKTVNSLRRAMQKLKGGMSGFGGAFIGGVGAIFGVLQKLYKSYVNSMYKVIAELENIQRAQENVRDKFGSLTKGPGQMVIKDAQAMGREFSRMGVSAGFAYKATTELINKMSELYGAMDPAQLAGFADMTQEARIEMGVLGFAAGLSGEELGALNNTFRALGEDSISAMKDITRRSHLMSKVLGISAKQAAKGFTEMTRNVKAFGNTNRQQMQDAMMKATQLGISIKDLSGIADAFFTFDQAAENVSKLSQAFGVQLDVMGMVTANSPADQMDQLRKAMFAAGKSAETLSRHELSLLASTTGLSAEAARMAFSMENQYKSQEEINSLIGETDPQKQMVNAMKDVSREIKSVVISITELVDSGTGPLGAFLEGMAKGMFFLSGDSAKSAQQFKKVIEQIFRIGAMLGRTLRESFEPLKDLFDSTDTGLAAMPGIFHKINVAILTMIDPLNQAYRAFKAFFGEDDPAKREQLFKSMVTNIKGAFSNLFGTLGALFGAGGTTGFGEKLGDFFSQAFAAAIPYVIKAAGVIGGGILDGIKTWWKGASSKQKAITGLIAGGLVLGLFSPFIIAAVKAAIAVKVLIAPVVLLGNAIKSLSAFMKDVSENFSEVGNQGTTALDVFEAIVQTLSDLGGRILQFAVSVANTLTLGLIPELDPAEFMKSWDLFTLEIKEGVLAGMEWLRDAGMAFWNNFKEGLSNGWQAVSEFISDKLDYIRGFFPSSEPKRGPLRGLAESGMSMFKNFGKGFREAAGKIGDMLGGVANALNPLSHVRSLFTSYLETMKFVSSVMSQVNDLFSGVGAGSVDVDIMTDKIAKVGEAIVKMNAAMAEVNTVQLRTKIEELVGTGLLTGDENAEAGKFIINLNVTMDADTVADVLVKNNLVVAP